MTQAQNQLAARAVLHTVFAAQDGALKTSSRFVAEAFDRQHKNVLQAYDMLECSQEFNRRNFAPVEYLDAKGQARRMIEMTFDGFIFLVMGFTGAKAAAIKERGPGMSCKSFASGANSRMIAPLREKGAAGFGDLMNRCDASRSSVPQSLRLRCSCLQFWRPGWEALAACRFPVVPGSPTRPGRRPHLAMGASVIANRTIGGQS